MSFDAIAWALKQDEGLSPTAKYVLIMLADFKNKDEEVCYPRISQIAEKALMSESGVRKCIAELQDVGLLKVKPRNRGSKSKSNVYELLTKPTSPDGGSKCQEVAAGGDTAGPSYKEEPVSKPVKEPVSNCDESQEDFSVKVKDVLGKGKLGKEEIFSKAERKGGKLTSKAYGDLWKRCRASADSDNGFGAELLNKEWSMLQKASKRIGDDIFPEVVWAVMENWLAFTKHAKNTAGAYPLPKLPSIRFFVKYVEAAADYAQNPQEPADSGWAPVRARPIAKKPLTKPKETSDNTDKPYTIEQLRARALKEFE